VIRPRNRLNWCWAEFGVRRMPDAMYEFVLQGTAHDQPGVAEGECCVTAGQPLPAESAICARRESVPARATGRARKWPCTRSHPCAARISSCSCVSTPSACAVIPRFRANAMIVCPMAASSASAAMFLTKDLSILECHKGAVFAYSVSRTPICAGTALRRHSNAASGRLPCDRTRVSVRAAMKTAGGVLVAAAGSEYTTDSMKVRLQRLELAGHPAAPHMVAASPPLEYSRMT